VEARGSEIASGSTGCRVGRVNILQRLVEEKRRPPGSSTYPRSVMRQHQLQKYRRELVAVANGRVHEVGGRIGIERSALRQAGRVRIRDRPFAPFARDCAPTCRPAAGVRAVVT
jgi:hypothetical protein